MMQCELFNDGKQICQYGTEIHKILNTIKDSMIECKFNNDTYFSSEGSIDDWLEIKDKIWKSMDSIEEILDPLHKFGMGYMDASLKVTLHNTTKIDRS
jgi:hypothetical protein